MTTIYIKIVSEGKLESEKQTIKLESKKVHI
jgi:hypothetical protein